MAIRYDPSARFDIDISEEIYRSGPDGEWPLRLYRPQGTGPFPTLLDVHGGAWSSGSYLNNESVDRALAATGIVVAAIEFRQAPQHTYPAQVADVNFGTRWLNTLGRRCGDARRVRHVERRPFPDAERAQTDGPALRSRSRVRWRGSRCVGSICNHRLAGARFSCALYLRQRRRC